MSLEHDVIERAVDLLEPQAPTFERLVDRRERKVRIRRIAAGVAGIAVFVAALVVVARGGALDRSVAPAVTGPTHQNAPRVGFIGLPPEGATPSTTLPSDLILSFIGRGETSSTGLIRVWVFADGRVVWDAEGDIAEGANEHRSGLLQQRLAPGGVDDLRAEILSTGLFEHGHLELLSAGNRGLVWGEVTVRVGDRVSRVAWSNERLYPDDPGTRATALQEAGLASLQRFLDRPDRWVPSNLWADREITAYVAADYTICYGGSERPLEQRTLLDELPAEAAAMIRHEPTKPYGDPARVFCTGLPTEEARMFARILEGAGVPRDDRDAEVRQSYLLQPDDRGPGDAIQIFLEPTLPNGGFELCSPCG